VMFSACVAMLILVSVYELSGATWPALELLGDWKWFLPLGVLLMSSVEIQNSWLARIKAFNTTSASLITGNTVTTGTRIGLGALYGSSIYGLIVGYLVGLAFRIAVQQTKSNQGLRAAFRYIGWPRMREIARRYSDFPRLNAPASLLFSLGSYMPVLLFGVMFSPVVAGFYAMADRLSRVPISIVAESMRQVFFQRAARIHQSGRSLKSAFLLSTGGLALFGAVPCAVLWVYGQQLLTWVLGARWFEAGRYLEIIAPWLFILWVAAPCHPVIIVLRRQRFLLSLEAVLTLLRLGSFGLAYAVGAEPKWALQAFVSVTVLGNLVMILAVLALVSHAAPSQSNIGSGTRSK